MGLNAVLVVVAYSLGSIPFGLLLTHWFSGRDVRQAGSGNIGATNVARVAGKGVGIVVLFLDAGKGALPVYFAVQQFPSDWTLHSLVAVAAFVGHVFPVWLRFKGGKGVATAAGVSAVLMPVPMLMGLIVFVALVAAFRVASIASLSSAFVVSLAAMFMNAPVEYVCLSLALFLLMLFTHRGNISRLLKRTENRV